MELVHQFVCRTAERRLGAALVAALVLVLFAAWCFVQDRGALQSEQRLREARRELDRRIGDLQVRIEQLAVDVAAQRQRVMASDKALRQARELKHTWEWFAVNRALTAANRERVGALESAHQERVGRFAVLQRQLRAASWELDGLELERDRVRAQEQADADGAPDAWERRWRRVRSWLLLGVALYLLGPVLLPTVLHRRRERRASSVAFSR